MGSSEKSDTVSTWDRTDGESLAVVMFSTDDENGLGVSNPETGEKAVHMESDGFVNSLSIADSKVSLKNAFSFSSIKGLETLLHATTGKRASKRYSRQRYWGIDHERLDDST